MREKVFSCLAFKTIPTTVAFVVFYAALFLVLFLTDDIKTIPEPSRQHGLSLDEAFADIQQIGRIPHPYNTRQNEVVREYLLNRVRNIARTVDFITVDDDQTSNVTFSLAVNTNNTRYVNYFEGLNIVTKIEGSKPELPGVLFNAHYDSVPTSPGATDDGIGTVTLLQLVEHFSKNRPKRTVVFNMNNGEEEGLIGAALFLEHPWAKLVDTFLNVDSGGVGGRPFLLRTTSTRLAKVFSTVPHPHGQIATADAFNRGIVKSASDFTVFAKAGLAGLDFTTYRRRSKYHTMGDNIPSFDKSSLYQMMESSLQIAETLANDDSPSTRDAGSPLYFDIFGESLFVTSLQTFFVINVLLLLVGPALVIVLLLLARAKGKSVVSGGCWGRGPMALVMSFVLTFAVAQLYSHKKPFAVYSAPMSVFATFLALGFLCMRLTIGTYAHFQPAAQHRSVTLLESFTFWWILLAGSTFMMGKAEVGGFYVFTFFYTGALTALVVGLLEHVGLLVALPRNTRIKLVVDFVDDEEGRTSETTPLLAKADFLPVLEDVDEDNVVGMWLIQFLLSIPFPVILVSQLAIVFIHSLRQAGTDSTTPGTVYLGSAIFSVLIFMPIIPFAHKLHKNITIAAAAIFVLATLYSVLLFPFSQEEPFRVFYQQKINLDTGINEVMLTGVEPWITRYIMPELPSSSSKDAALSCNKLDADFRALLPYCSWHGLSPAVSPGNTSDWMTVDVTKEAPGKGRISIYSPNSRGCRLYFDHDTPVTAMTVLGGNNRTLPDFPIHEDGLWEAHLWSRTWNRTFDVSVTWDNAEKPLKGRASCLWHERVGVPAFDEVMALVPNWVLVSTRGAGLVEGWKEFEVR